MEQTRKAKDIARDLRYESEWFDGRSEADTRELLISAADMIDALLAGSALADPAENGAILGKSDESKKAALRAFPKSGTDRMRVLNLIHGYDDVGGLTDEQMQTLLKMSPNSQRPRRVELVDGGWVQDSGKIRIVESGGTAAVWCLTAKGFKACEDNYRKLEAS